MDTNNSNRVSKKVIYPELSYKIVGIFFNVQKELGLYAREKQYSDLIEKKLIEQNLSYKRELPISDSGNILDFLVEDKIILELKSTREITGEHYRQIQNYLQQTDVKLGILVNFRSQRLRPIRVLKLDDRHS